MENVDSHVVIMSGLKDLRVNHHNSEYYYKRLISMGKSCEYYEFPSCDHALASSKAELFILDKTIKILKKFKK